MKLNRFVSLFAAVVCTAVTASSASAGCSDRTYVHRGPIPPLQCFGGKCADGGFCVPGAPTNYYWWGVKGKCTCAGGGGAGPQIYLYEEDTDALIDVFDEIEYQLRESEASDEEGDFETLAK